MLWWYSLVFYSMLWFSYLLKHIHSLSSYLVRVHVLLLIPQPVSNKQQQPNTQKRENSYYLFLRCAISNFHTFRRAFLYIPYQRHNLLCVHIYTCTVHTYNTIQYPLYNMNHVYKLQTSEMQIYSHNSEYNNSMIFILQWVFGEWVSECGLCLKKPNWNWMLWWCCGDSVEKQTSYRYGYGISVKNEYILKEYAIDFCFVRNWRHSRSRTEIVFRLFGCYIISHRTTFAITSTQAIKSPRSPSQSASQHIS